MVFSSLLFVFAFLPLCLLFYSIMKTITGKNIVLIIFSIIFYSWGGPKYLIILAGMAFVSWLCAIRIEKADEGSVKRKLWMAAECIILLGTLTVFKYTNFITANLNYFFGFPKEITKIVLPIGISFYTFQLISYVVDVYREEVYAQRSYWKLFLYCSLFHQCIAGPIVRYQTVADEIDNRSVSIDDVTEGIRRFAVGLAKKAVLANSCAVIADALLKDTAAASTSGLWLGMLCYMFQIYLDFSAYSDMAIGMGRMIGFHYLENFNYPYIAVSVQDFWRRWHISLSSFFRDYVYIPLGGNRRGKIITLRNMLIVWALTGIWHGASWNYILWGLYFFAFLAFERFVAKKLLSYIPDCITWLLTMLVVFFGWVIFRFENMAVMADVFQGLFGINHNIFSLSVGYTFLNNIFIILLSAAAVTPAGRKIRNLMKKKLPTAAGIIDAVTPAVLIILSTMALVGNSYNPFLYFQF